MIDALCDPPETFVIGAVVAHVLTYAAFRRQVTRMLLRGGVHPVDDSDPIDRLRGREREVADTDGTRRSPAFATHHWVRSPPARMPGLRQCQGRAPAGTLPVPSLIAAS